MLFGFKTKPTFTVESEATIAVPPKVDFGTSAPAPAVPAPAPAAPAGGGDASGSLSPGY
jgi:LemA protein